MMNSPDLVAERLRTLREMNGWTQKDLAAASGISQAQISSIEKLRREASIEALAAFSKATATPLTFFSVASPEAPSDSLHFRKNKTAPIKLTTQVKAFFREAYRVSTTIVDGIDFPISHLPFADSRSGTMDQDQIEKLAKATRNAFGVDSLAPIPNLTRALERTGAAVFRIGLPNVEQTQVLIHCGGR